MTDQPANDDHGESSDEAQDHKWDAFVQQHPNPDIDASPDPQHSHSHSHSHPHSMDMPGLHRQAARWLWWIVAACAAATVVAVIALWPSGTTDFEDPLLLGGEVVDAKVTGVEQVDCQAASDTACHLITVELASGTDAGATASFELGSDVTMQVGDGIEVTSYSDQSGDTIYSFFDYDRDYSMLLLVAAFVAAVLALGRWRGLGAIAGLGFSLIIIVVFTVPAILDGGNSVSIAIATASLIAFAALFLAHGFEAGTAVALLSTFASLIVTAALAWIFVGATNLTGLSDDSTLVLSGLAGGIDPRGILLAGIVIGALGVLDDVTVTQVSAVWELKRARPDLTTSELVRPALRIGRDHISSTVNTLFLAYAGAALPLLLLFSEAGQGLGDVATREIVATEVVRALVGSIGLVASVPISTWLAALVVSPPDAVAGTNPAG